MSTGKTIKVLIVDDSLVFRELLARGISAAPDIEVVATAGDPFDARDKIIKYRPDVMTCDVEMPKMNGIEFVRRLIPQYPMPVIIVSTASETVFDAMNAGAVDFVAKPDMKSHNNAEHFIDELVLKIKIAVSARVSQANKGVTSFKPAANIPVNNKNNIIAIGASTGGTEALYNLLKSLPGNMPGIVIVQHIPPVFSRMFAERLDSSIALSVKEAHSGDFVGQGKVLIAPGDQHMIIKKIGDRYKVECFQSEKVNGHCPSVDVLFESVAKEAGSNAIGVILTGMGYDGAKGLLMMRRNGARTIGQDEHSSVVYGMPKAAYNIGAVEKQAPLENIPQLIAGLLK